jgi:signal transduction histidine kinase
MHRLLKRQVKKTFGKNFDITELDKKTLKLFEEVTETYANFDEEKKFLNYTIKKNKKELKEAYISMLTSSRLAGIGEMMENITHQWKQPLSIILNIVSFLKLEIKDNKDLKIIEEQTRYLDNTIRDFKDFSSHSSKEKTSFLLEKSVKETIKLFNFQAITHIIVINSTLEKGLMLQGDIGKFNQVLLVLFSNAKDAFLTKSAKNRVISIKSETIDNQVIIEVHDNAGGIPKIIIDKIFEPYFTTKFKNKGTGVGLSMTYNIIIKMGGTLEVKNYKDGALFKIMLPKHKG